MIDIDGNEKTVETFIDEVMDVQKEEGTTKLAVTLEGKFNMKNVSNIRSDRDLIFARGEFDIGLIPEKYLENMTYAICIDDDGEGLTLELKLN